MNSSYRAFVSMENASVLEKLMTDRLIEVVHKAMGITWMLHSVKHRWFNSLASCKESRGCGIDSRLAQEFWSQIDFDKS